MSDELTAPRGRQLSVARCIRITRICCGVVIAIGLSVLLGWWFDSVMLKSVLPGAIAMKPNTAVALGFGALSLLFFTRPTADSKPLLRKLSLAFAVMAVTIGALTLSEYVIGMNLGIDELLFRDSARGTVAGYSAGRMAPISAFNFICLGAALLLLHRPKYTLHAQGLTACAACTSLLAIIGYVFGVEALYRSGHFSAIAMNTAFAFLALCTGLWSATTDVGVLRIVTGSGTSGLLLRRFGLAALVLPLLSSWLQLQSAHYAWFEHDLGAALFALINVVTFSLLIWFSADSLHKSERKEAVVQEHLRAAHLELEDRVRERTSALETALRVKRQIMEYSLDVICIIDAGGRFTTVSAACEKVWGYAPAELIGRRFIELVHPDDREKTKHAAAATKGDKPLQELENRFVRKDGSIVDLTWSVSWSHDEARMFCVARDTTERKRSEEALQQAREDAERANRAKSEFLANMSHEIRTPMNGILGMTELTLDTELKPDQREYLRMVNSSARSLLGVINDILDFSKIEAGKLEMESISFSLRETIGTMLKPLGMRADEKQLELNSEISANVPDSLIGDPMRLRQILLNLTDNAIKFTDRGQIVVTVTAGSPTDGQTEMHFMVSDTGVGIPEEKQAAVFEAFAQVDGSTTRNYGGTGLGLAIATRIVQQMGGRIWVESRVGVGTTFHFTACFRSPEESLAEVTPFAVASRAEREEKTGSRAAHSRALQILVVEDNAINRAVVAGMLSRQGHTPVHAANGAEALEAVAGTDFDIILMDIQMPEMDGFEATARIRQRQNVTGQHTRIVAMTAHAMTGDRERCLAADMDDYLSKPLTADDLLRVLGAVEATEPQPKPKAKSATAHTYAELHKICEGDDDLVAELIAIFRADTPRLLEVMRTAATERDAPALAAGAHNLLSSLGGIRSGPRVRARTRP